MNSPDFQPSVFLPAPSFSPSRIVVSTLRFLLLRATLIAATIFVGVFITVVIVGQPARNPLQAVKSPFEVSIEKQIERYLQENYLGNATDQEIATIRAQLREAAGLNLPSLPRYMLWTYRALTFDWGPLTVANISSLNYGRRTPAGAKDIVLQYLPNTLLLIATAYLLVFVIGIPLSLYLARHHGSWLEALLAFLWPLSSVPSWVIGVLLVALFAVQLRWLPVGGMFDTHQPEEPIQYILVLGKHMLLPVLALVIGLLAQLVHAWRAYFAVHAGEDYVDLAVAKGLPRNVLDRRYVLRPALPYVITSFALTLVGFWQMSMALEVVLQWPGLGWLYIAKALPNFWGDSMYPGELIVAVGIVVIFAYALGLVVFLLDLAYALADPRIHLLSTTVAGTSYSAVRSGTWSLKGLFQKRPKAGALEPTRPRGPVAVRTPKASALRLWGQNAASFVERLGSAWKEFRRDPGALFGMLIVFGLFVGAGVALTAYPYSRINSLWGGERLSGRAYVPRLAMPAWVSLLTGSSRLSTLVVDENAGSTEVQPSPLSSAWSEKNTVLTFDYPYGEGPSEVYLYLNSVYHEKPPFVSVQWVYPDGRRLELRGTAIPASTSYDFERGISLVQFSAQFPSLAETIRANASASLPVSNMLFGASGSQPNAPLNGRYRLEVKSLLFEAGSDVKSQLVLLGSVYGAAGTDYWRRDLTVPLLWGMPFALLFGILGAGAASLLALLAAAAGAWLGGWADAAVQRLTDVNMILPLLAIGVLAAALWNLDLWIIIALIVLLSAFGAPVKTYRSALLQIKEAPYVEAARAYGTGNSRMITEYLLPRIMPVVIPQLVILVPSFVFLEATLGLFNIRSTYPSWGTVISEALSRGALYGSRFWVLEPISLVLLTGLAFALMGSAMERISNPRLAPRASAEVSRIKAAVSAGFHPARARSRGILSTPGMIALILMCVLASAVFVYRGLSLLGGEPSGIMMPANGSAASGVSVTLTSPAGMLNLPASQSGTQEQATTIAGTAEAGTVPAVSESMTAPGMGEQLPAVSLPATYTLRHGEFPYCIARRLDVDPSELLALSSLGRDASLPAGTVLHIPQTGKPFPGQRSRLLHPTQYTVVAPGLTIAEVACTFGDVDPAAIAEMNGLDLDAALYMGQVLEVP